FNAVWDLNLANGDLNFEYRGTDGESRERFLYLDRSTGEIYTPPTYYSTTTNSPTLRVGTSSGRITSTTSSRKHKLAIETVKDPYRILKLDPKDWYDRGDVE